MQSSQSHYKAAYHSSLIQKLSSPGNTSYMISFKVFFLLNQLSGASLNPVMLKLNHHTDPKKNPFVLGQMTIAET